MLKPKAYFSRVQDITIQFLIKNKIKALILDVDNTLIDYYKNLSEDVIKWALDLQGQGIKMYILSNSNNTYKIKTVADKLEVPYVGFARKPFKSGFLKVKKELNIDEKDFWYTAWKRPIENYIKKKIEKTEGEI